ncbi:hypothetical protein [Georgenia faecalis]|uniref:Uncharacterized protein n=1 Tax=Georgenia faecalis TaxID=2483799 RepID=A0ABV9D9G2_9MICO|nr:hypothetical protein [Georgenia faecalis]
MQEPVPWSAPRAPLAGQPSGDVVMRPNAWPHQVATGAAFGGMLVLAWFGSLGVTVGFVLIVVVVLVDRMLGYRSIPLSPPGTTLSPARPLRSGLWMLGPLVVWLVCWNLVRGTILSGGVPLWAAIVLGVAVVPLWAVGLRRAEEVLIAHNLARARQQAG